MIFLVILCGLGLTAILLFSRAETSVSIPRSLPFERLQNQYLTVYYLATFSDWLQGPYIYKLYSYYGYKEEEIAFLYIAGFGSSSVFGAVIGYIGDKYGRKNLCILYGFLYSLCCLTKISSNFYALFAGRVLGGISTSILFSTFEAWYINEHINHCNLPPEWLNMTFSKASSFSGFLAIMAGILSQIFAETLNLGPVFPFVLAIPCLLISSYLTAKTWEEHFYFNNYTHKSFISPLYHIFIKNPILICLGMIQSLFECVMYTFIFSYTPIISYLDPPLGIVFASFMLAFMIGSMIYSLPCSDRCPPQLVLVLTSVLSFMNIFIVTIVINYMLYFPEVSLESRVFLIHVCFICFVLYEFSVGLYFPVISYLKSRVVCEEHRASIANWFRLPMNIFTCISLTINQFSEDNKTDLLKSDVVFKKFNLIYISISMFLLIVTLASMIFNQKYNQRFFGEDSFVQKKITLPLQGPADQPAVAWMTVEVPKGSVNDIDLAKENL